MSWGERSCIYLYDPEKPCRPTLKGCNVNCHFYEWDKKTAPDSKRKNLIEEIEAAHVMAGENAVLGNLKRLGF